MIDPNNITNYQCTNEILEEQILFWILAAGKQAKTASKQLKQLLDQLEGRSPFEKIKRYDENLAILLKSLGVGCYNHKAKSFLELVNSGIDLKTCSIKDLEQIHGIGRKTSRCFIIHSRETAEYAGLDTHILQFLNDLGHKVPKSTPNSQKVYEEIETIFVNYCKQKSRPVAKFDLMVWRIYSQHPHLKKRLLKAFSK